MSELNALGVIEMYGLVACIEASDAMVKSANVRLLQYGEVSAGMVSIIVEGDVAACQASVNAGVAAAQRVGGQVIASFVIPRPAADTADMILNMIPQGREAYKKYFGGGNSSSGGNNEPSPPTPPAPKPPALKAAKVGPAKKVEVVKAKAEAPKKVEAAPKAPVKDVKKAEPAKQPVQKEEVGKVKSAPATDKKQAVVTPASEGVVKVKVADKVADKAPSVKTEDPKKTEAPKKNEVVGTESVKKPAAPAKNIVGNEVVKSKVEPASEVKKVIAEPVKVTKSEIEETEIISSVIVNERKPEVEKHTEVTLKAETLPIKVEENKVPAPTNKSGVVSVMTQLVQATEGNAVTPEELDKVIQYISGAAKGYSWKEIAKKFPLYSKTKALQRKLEEAVTAGKIVKTGSRYCKKPK